MKFAEGSVQIGSLLYYRTIKDDSGMIVDPHEGLELAEVTAELAAAPMLTMMTNGNPPPIGSLLCNEDNRRLVSCASASTSVPSTALSPTYDTWVRIRARPAIALITKRC